jgi:hypothetical protein
MIIVPFTVAQSPDFPHSMTSRGRQPMTNKQRAALGLHLLSVMDKLYALTPPVPGPLLLFTGHPDHGQRVFVASQVTVQAQAERSAIAPVSLHPGVAFVEVLRSDDVAVCASLEQRTVECEAEPAGFIDDMNLKACCEQRTGHAFFTLLGAGSVCCSAFWLRQISQY